MEKEKYYIGNYKEDSKEYRGWFIGYFIKEGLRKNDRIEIKWWEFPQGAVKDHKNKIQFYATEVTIILKGEIAGHINGEKINLKEGEYVVIPSTIENNLKNVISEKAKGITIKFPSLPHDKITEDNIRKVKNLFQ